MTETRSFLARLVTWLIAGLVLVLALKLVLFLLGKVVGVGLFLAFTLLPIMVLGWFALWLWRKLARPADENW